MNHLKASSFSRATAMNGLVGLPVILLIASVERAFLEVFFCKPFSLMTQ
jgi:hypothetical protein